MAALDWEEAPEDALPPVQKGEGKTRCAVMVIGILRAIGARQVGKTDAMQSASTIALGCAVSEDRAPPTSQRG